MPAALTVNQSLVDNYLARVDRFFNNVQQFEQQLKEMTSAIRDRFEPAATQMAEPIYQESVAAQPKQEVVTADDIDIDALLSGVDLNGEMSI